MYCKLFLLLLRSISDASESLLNLRFVGSVAKQIKKGKKADKKGKKKAVKHYFFV